MSYQQALDSAAAKVAVDKLHLRFNMSRDNAINVWSQARDMVIVDYDIVVDDMRFEPQEPVDSPPMYFTKVGGNERSWKLHPHAMRQMATEVGIPTTFVNTLTKGEEWERRELSDLLNERFKRSKFKQRSFQSRASFINRVVADEVRGFVSPSFKVWLSTPHMLEAFARECSTYHAMPVEAYGSSLCFTFRSMLPLVFEPKAGEFIAIGCSFSNSDFGAGSLKVMLDVMRIASGSPCSTKTVMFMTHGGGARKEQEEESAIVSSDTTEMFMKAAQGKVKDAVRSALKPEAVNGLLSMVEHAMNKEVGWPKLMQYFAGKLNQDEIASLEQIIEGKKESKELPPLRYEGGTAIIDLWWASSAVAAIADSVTDVDRKADLREMAGGLLLK